MPDTEANTAYHHAVQGYYQHQKKHYAEALAEYREALRLKPEYGEVHALAGAIYSKLRQHDTAIVHLEKSIALGPASAIDYHELGLAYAGKCDIDGVQRAWEEVLRLEPRYSPCCVRRGLALIYLGKRQWKRALHTWFG